MSRFLETFCKIDVSRAKSQGPDLADLMNVSAPVLISADLCRMSQLVCSFLLQKYSPASSRPKKHVSNPLLLFFNMVWSGPPSPSFPPSFPCRCRFLRMSQLACSFLLICVECLSSRAHFCCGCSFLRMSQLACSFLLICVECLSSRAHFCCRCRFLRMSELACSFPYFCGSHQLPPPASSRPKSM